MNRIENRVALVSGASRGVGLATARALCERGARVVLTARGSERLEHSTAELRREGFDVACIAGDVAEWSDADAMVRCAVERFGRLDILINNAGVSMRGRFDDLSPQVCRRVIDTNLLGAVYLTRAAIDQLIAARGSVVFISSIAGLFGLPNASAYCASKLALTGLAESLRVELPGVHVGVAHLGFTEHDSEKRILGAQGEGLLPTRPAHQTQAHVAGALVQMVERRRRKVVLTPVGNLGAWAYRLSPGLVQGAIALAQRTQLGVAQRFA
jgi:NAD(P)-dependent dehydrogenase (short-subunit alcohol dehydrogenase family)